MSNKRERQLQFHAFKDYTRTEHGGDLRKGKRKLARPIATKTPMHITLRSSKAKGQWSMLRSVYAIYINEIIIKYAIKHKVHVMQYANVGNHIHLLIRAKTKEGLRAFLKTITGLIARLITGAVKGQAMGQFWDSLAYSRIVQWGRDLKNTTRYVIQNAPEAFGVPTSRKPNGFFKGKVFIDEDLYEFH